MSGGWYNRDMVRSIDIPHDQIVAFCRKWKVKELAVFGSVLRDDFAADSDVDVLIELDPDSTVSLWNVPEMEDELAALLGRRDDLVFKGGLRNPFRRHEILSTRQVVYAA